ncbi:MAG TPA: extracellular solute-binding protein [Usitatibacter sp.]|nr:extracellular solute-binding protein [Usitatibacter sp.]
MMRAALLLLASVFAATALAAEPTPGVLAVAGLHGPDRAARLAAGAKAEGELMLYSSLTQEDQLRLAADFKARYGVTLRFWRGSQANILQRVVTETRGGRFDFDVIETNAPQIEAIAREQLLQKISSPHLGEVLLPDILPPSGEWAPDRLNLIVYAYNTNAIKPADLPRSWLELAEPKWKGRIGMESTNVEWFETLVEGIGEDKGLELFRRLGDNGVAVRTGHTHSTGRVIAGEIPLFLGVYSHDVERMKQKGAPIDWFMLPPAIVLPSAVAMSRRAPHPHAAALFCDYMLADGQRFYTEVHRVPANRRYDTPVRRLVEQGAPIRVVNSRQAIDDYDKWLKRYRKLIVDRSQH